MGDSWSKNLAICFDPKFLPSAASLLASAATASHRERMWESEADAAAVRAAFTTPLDLDFGVSGPGILSLSRFIGWSSGSMALIFRILIALPLGGVPNDWMPLGRGVSIGGLP